MSSDQNDYNKGGFIAFLFSMVITIGFFVYIVFVHKGVDLKEVAEQQPAAAGQAVAEQPAQVTHKKIADIASVKDPWIATPELVEHGAAVYSTACAMCHGPSGKGDGPAGMSLNPKPRNFVEGKWKYGGDSLGLFNTITNGVKGTSMAAFGYMPVAERWALVHYLRSITENKVADDEAQLKAKAAALK